MRSVRMLVWGLVFLGTSLGSSYAKTAYGYVANNGANTVSVINATTNAVVKTIPVGTAPYGIVINQAGTLAYVTNTGSNNVSVISTSTNAVTATIPVSSGPMDITLGPNGTTAYVSCGTANQVAVINTAKKTITTNITVTNPVGLAVTPDGAFLYVVSSSAGKVIVISTLTNTVFTTISLGTGTPIGIAISPDGSTAYVTNSTANTVSVIQTSNNVVVNTINVSSGPYYDAFSPDGHWVYVANYNGGSGNFVTVIDTSTQTIAGTIVVGTGPTGFGFVEDSSHVGVVNKGSNNVSVINTATRTVSTTITVGTAPTGGGVMGTVHVSTVAGGFAGDGGPATSAAIMTPSATAIDSAGNLYIADVTGNRIRKVSTTGTISTYAGNGICGYNGDGLASAKAMICAPTGITLDHSGSLVFTEQGTNRVRSISKTGKVSTIVGNGAYGNSGDGGPATSAQIGDPFWVAYDSAGNLYISLVTFCVVRKVDTTGTISTVAGNGTCGYSGDGGKATAAMLNGPRGLAFDSAGNLYIADWGNHRVRKVNPSGTITTFAGTGKGGFSGDGGPATSAKIGSPRAVVVQGNALYISNAGSSRYRSVDLTSNVINTFAGSTFGYDGDGHTLLTSQFAGGGSLTFDAAGNPVFSDGANSRVRKATGGIVNTIAGGYIGADGAKATAAAWVLPEAVTVDKAGNLYVADYTGNRVRKVSAGLISTIAGNGISGYSGDGGPGKTAMLYAPQGVAVDSAGDVFISDSGNGVIREVNAAGNISTFATNASFIDVYKIAIDSSNNLYVDDDLACVVWKITPAAVVSIAAGVLNTCGYNGDGIAATTADLNSPYGVAVDASGNLYIADYGNNRVREVNTAGTISTIAGTGTCGYTGDGGSATSAELCPNGVAVDSAGDLFVADNFTRIREIRKGTIMAFAGAGFGYNGDGLWPLYTGMDSVVDVAVDSKGAVYELDDWDHRLRKIQ